MIKKHNYEAPDAELLVVRFEGNFCETTNSAGGDYSDNDLGDLTDGD